MAVPLVFGVGIGVVAAVGRGASKAIGAAALDTYLEMFSPLFETAMKSYCEDKGKTEDHGVWQSLLLYGEPSLQNDFVIVHQNDIGSLADINRGT